MEMIFGMGLTNLIYAVLFAHNDNPLSSQQIADYIVSMQQIELDEGQLLQLRKRVQTHLRKLCRANPHVTRIENFTDVKTIYYTYQINTNGKH